MVDVSSVYALRIRATRVAVFLDTCYSEGALVGGKGAAATKPGSSAVARSAISVQTLDHSRQGAGRVIAAASKSDQESLESDKLRHGYFTFYLVQALRQQNGAQPLSQVFAYVQEHVSSGVTQDFKAYGWHQDPVMRRSEPDTDFTLGEPAASTVALAGARDKVIVGSASRHGPV